MLTTTMAGALRHPEGWQVSAAGGRFEIRLTRDPLEIAAAQRLRFQIFYEEMNAEATPDMAASRLDFDDFDRYCDHLMVYDRSRPTGQQAVGTYRLLRQPVAERFGGFYSASEYELSPLLEWVGDSRGLLELGRSCVHADYRTNATIQLLWRGIATYMADHGITHMFGCASLPGTDPEKLKVPLAYLHANHLAPRHLRVRALPERHVPMNLIAPADLSLRDALAQLPPLIKAYLRLGAYIGDGAVVDEQFGTTDVFILLPIERIAPKYYTHFDRSEMAEAVA